MNPITFSSGGRRFGKNWVTELAIADALRNGAHVHFAGADGTRCLNNTCNPADLDPNNQRGARMSTRLPEWFIGGPWHGMDKLAHPVTRNMAPDNWYVLTYDLSAILEEDPTSSARRGTTYNKQTYMIGEAAFTIWIANNLDLRAATTMLAEILLAPHWIQDELH